MNDAAKLFALPMRSVVVTLFCDQRCDWCRHCQERELPPAEVRKLLDEPPGTEPTLVRLSGGDPFRQRELKGWVDWCRRNPRSAVCIEGPAASLGSSTADAVLSRLLELKPEMVAAVLPSVDAATASRLTGRPWDPARALGTLAALAEAGVAVEVVLPVNPQTVGGLAETLLAAARRLGPVDLTLRRAPLVKRAGRSLPQPSPDEPWGELGSLSAALASLPAALPGGARLRMDLSSGYAPCMLEPRARRPDVVPKPRTPRRREDLPLGAACSGCAWLRQCQWRSHAGKPPESQVAPLSESEALVLQEESGASVSSHVARTFRTDRARLGLPDLLCLAPWTTLSTSEPRLHPVPCALSWVDTALTPGEISAETGIPEAEARRREERAMEGWRGPWNVMDNPELSLRELWNSPLLSKMRREMLPGGASSRCRVMCRVVMGVEERGLSCFEPADADLAPPVAANRRLLLEEIRAGKSVLSADPLELDAGVSARCNISCGFCNGPEEGYGDLTDARRDEIVTMLPSLMRFGVCGPGEPLMSRNYIALLGHISDTGYPSLAVSLTTNGTLLTPAFLERHANVPWSHVRISINAGTHETHERMTGVKLFDRVLRNLDALCALRDRRPGRFRVTLSCVLGEVQMGDLHHFAELVSSHGTDVAIEPMTGNLRSLSPWVRPEKLALLADELASVADDYALKNPPLSRAFRAAEGYARERLSSGELAPLAMH